MILVFGGNGQLGRELARAASERGTALAGLGRDEADITDAASVRRAIDRHRPALVVNAAAYTKVDLAETEREAARRANALGPAILAAACARSGVALVHLSTDYVFDGAKTGGYVEDDPIAPLSVYGATKAAGEDAVRGACQRHIIVRTSWVFGAFGRNFLKTMLALAQERDELRVVADQRGSPTSTRDLASAIHTVASRLAAGQTPWGTYHFAGVGVTTWHGFAERIVAAQAPVTGRRPTLVPIATRDDPRPARRPANSALDSSLFVRTFGIRPRRWEDEAEDAVKAVLAELVKP